MMQRRYLRDYMKNSETNKYRLVFSEYADDDLNEIHDYISQILKEPIIAERLILKIEREISILKTSPYISREIRAKRQREPCRRLVIGNYIVLYQIKETQKEVLISHIFYGRRNYLVIDD